MKIKYIAKESTNNEKSVIKTSYWHRFYDRAEAIVNSLENGTPIALDRIALYLTTGCNENCKKCTVRTKFKYATLPLDKIGDIFDQGIKLGLKTVHYTGGEVTIIPNYTEYVKLAISKGLDVTMTTNGSSGASGARKIVEAGITQIFVTIDAPDKNDPGSIRRYNNALEFAKELVKLKKDGKNFIFYIYSVLNKYNYKKAPKHIDNIYSHLYPYLDGVYSILIKKFPAVAYLGLNNKQIVEYKSQLLPKISKVLQKYYGDKETAERSSTYLLAESIAGYSKEESKFYSKGFFSGKIVAPCYLSLSQLTISASGCVHQCLTHLRNTDESPLGNLYQQSLWEIKDKMMSPKRVISKVPLIPECMHICNPGYGFFNYLVFSMLKERKLYKYLPDSSSPNKEAIKDIESAKLLKEAIKILENKDCIWALIEYSKEFENYKNKK